MPSMTAAFNREKSWGELPPVIGVYSPQLMQLLCHLVGIVVAVHVLTAVCIHVNIALDTAKWLIMLLSSK